MDSDTSTQARRSVTGDSSTTSSDGDVDGLNDHSDPLSVSQIFLDAAKYEEMLVEAGCVPFPDKLSSAGNDVAVQIHGTDGDEEVDVKGFEDLVGRDLSLSEYAITGRLAKLSVTSLRKSSDGDDLWGGGMTQTEEPESYDDDDDDDEDTTTSDVSRTSGQVSQDDGLGNKSWQLAPETVVDLIVQEFGPLAEEGEKEELILETDAGLFLDVVIVGVVHLTTHRLTFHASLLAARPDLLPAYQVIKAGPATLHRKGLRMKRRIWLELSHDMICTYNTSSEEERIHPFRTVLLSSIKEIGAVDSKRPKIIRIFFHFESKDADGVVEFTTEEAANDWRRELQGALFLYRYRRKQDLDGDSVEASTGIRLSIPLHRIEDVRFQTKCFNFKSIFSLDVLVPQIESINVNGSPPNCEKVLEKDKDKDKDTQTIRLHLCPITSPVDKWSQLREHVTAAKERYHLRKQDQGEDSDSDSFPVIADFGPLSFTQEDVKVVGSQFVSNEERAVRESLALGDNLDLWIVKARVRRGVACSGYFVVCSQVVGFWSKFITQSDIRYRIAVSTIRLARPSKSKHCSRKGVTLEMEGHDNLRFEFKTSEIRDEAICLINEAVRVDRKNRSRNVTPLSSSSSSSMASGSLASTPTAISIPTKSATLPSPSWTGIISPISRALSAISTTEFPSTLRLNLPKAINIPSGLLPNRPSLHFVCLTIGSRGDVQPYIALGLRLKSGGHRVTIVTHEEYQDWIEGFGITHRQAGGDPSVLMKLSVDNKMFSPEFFKESLGKFRPWLDQLLEDAWAGCQGADVLLESPSAMAGVHIAEALKIPYFRTFTMPWTKTTQFPHAFLSPPVNAPTFNSLSYILFDNVMWVATSGQINRWRRNTLKLDATDMGHLAQSKITFIYNFSQAVVPKPLDWGDTTVVSGYWFLDNPELDWSPPQSLLDWMDRARKDGKPIVYIGFGSITVPRPNRTTRNIVKAVLKSDVRAIISKGWSARFSKDNEQEVEIPPECYQLDKVPHDWLFPQVDAALHHGGAGTTGASLRAGIPTLIKPWFGDQFFWASRVQQLGAGLKVPSLRVNDLAAALSRATTSRVMKEKAASVGERIRSEDGLHTAIHTIYTYLNRAAKDRTTLD